MFANADARHVRGDRLKFAPNAAWCLWLQIERLVLRRATPHEQLNAAFGAAAGSSMGPTLKQGRDRQAGQPQTADAEKLTPSQSIAQTSTRAVKVQHRTLGGEPAQGSTGFRGSSSLISAVQHAVQSANLH